MSTPHGDARGVDSADANAQEIMRLEQQRADAYRARDAATLERLLPDNFVFTRSIGVLHKQELLRMIGSGELTFEGFERSVDEVKVYLNTALVLGRDRIIGQYQGEDFSGHFRFTNTYVCTQGRWRVVASHASRIEP